MKADGHRDGTFVVDLTTERPRGEVTLVPLVPTPTPREDVSVKTGRTERPARSSRTSRSSRASERAPDRIADKTPDRTPDKPAPTTTSPEPRVTEKKQSERSGSKIDRSDTMDPFRTRP